MKLSRSDFVEVCQALAQQKAENDARAVAAGADEKRGGTRMTVEDRVIVATLHLDGTPAESFTALTRDISFAGIGLLQRKKLAQNTQIIVQLPRKDKEPLTILCKAVHVRELADGVYVVGAEFMKEMSLNKPSPADAAEVDRLRKAMMQ